MTRCFLALELEEASRAYLRERVAPFHRLLAGRHRWRVRLVPPANWHLTLLFFPGLDDGERQAVWEPVAAATRAGAWGALDFVWRGLTLWPSPRRPALVCLEAAPFPGSTAWPIAPLLGDPPFSKADLRHVAPYRPHITLMRLERGRQPNLAEAWDALGAERPTIEPERIRFDRVAILLSTVSRAEPIYPRERSLALVP
ncbi:MAG: hypothetical protein HY423_05525 [Candidatus Lambdaproteobacteria bacterium]|nr:hypothetical protein [Candidatus Lambdaproteobacteria bacterium]